MALYNLRLSRIDFSCHGDGGKTSAGEREVSHSLGAVDWPMEFKSLMKNPLGVRIFL